MPRSPHSAVGSSVAGGRYQSVTWLRGATDTDSLRLRRAAPPRLRPEGQGREQVRDALPHLVARDDGVDHPVRMELLGGLRAARHPRADRLLDDPGPGEADQGT